MHERVREERHRAAFLPMSKRSTLTIGSISEDVVRRDGIHCPSRQSTPFHMTNAHKRVITRPASRKRTLTSKYSDFRQCVQPRCVLQAIGLQQFAPCRSTLISHATKCTQNWNHAMHSNAIAHAVHEDSGRDRSGSRISAVSTAAREAEGASLAGRCSAGLQGGLRTACAQHYALKRGLKY